MEKRIRWIIWMFVFILCLVFASYYGGVVPFMLLKLVLVIPIVGGIYCIWVACHFRFYQNIPEKTVVKEEPVEYTLCISNEDWIEYGSVQIGYYENRARLLGVSEKERYLLRRGEKKEIQTRMCCKYRGEYEVGVEYFVIRDYLELIRLRYKPMSSFKVLVLPRIISWIYEKEVLDDKTGSNNVKTVRNGEIDVQVRSYVNGDSLNHIHWKASAKAGKLMTREECETRKEELLLVVDLKQQFEHLEERLQYEDNMMEQMVAIVHTCLIRQIPCIIVMQDGKWKRMEVTNQNQWKKFYEYSGRIHFEANEEMEQAKYLQTELGKVRYAVFLTKKISTGLSTMLSQNFRQINTNVVLVETDQTSLRRL